MLDVQGMFLSKLAVEENKKTGKNMSTDEDDLKARNGSRSSGSLLDDLAKFTFSKTPRQLDNAPLALCSMDQ